MGQPIRLQSRAFQAVNLFVDTSVWSLAFRRDAPALSPPVGELIRSLESGRAICSTGLVLQELLQGFSGPKARAKLIERFSAVPLLVPSRDNHIAAAELRNRCRRAGTRIHTIDALLAQLCIEHDLVMLTTDSDFEAIAKFSPLKTWHA